MAQAIDLATSNIDGLFEQYSIEEIQQILKKIRGEVDKKREDLRITVGNRYRDLIDAADTISAMKDSSLEVMKHLNVMENLLSSLKHRQLLGFQTDAQTPEHQRELNQVKREYRALAAQVKLLMELPEIMWKLLEMEEYCSAAEVRQLAQHLYTGLSVQGNSYYGGNIHKWFPVVNRQWVAISSFTDVIVKESCNQLKMMHLSIEKASNATCALQLLRADPATMLLTNYLKLRCEAIHSLVNSQGTIKQQVSNFIQAIATSLAAAHALFIEGLSNTSLPQAVLFQKLQEACQRNAISIVQQAQLSSSPIVKHLPPIVMEFRPLLSKPWEPLPIGEILQACQKWFEELQSWTSHKFSQLLGCITTIKTLAALRETAYTTMQLEPYRTQWNELSVSLLGSKICLWDRLFRPAIIEKIETLIQNQLDDALDTLKQLVAQNGGKFELTQWLWTESPNDLPQSIASLPKSSGVYMKTRCYIPTVQQVCSLWDHKLNLLLEDLQHFQAAKIEDDIQNQPFDRFEFRNYIFSVLEHRCVQNVERFIEFLNDTSKSHQNSVVFAGKLLSSLTDLCPNLRRCFVENTEGKSWIAFKDLLHKASTEMYRSWAKELLIEFGKCLERDLKVNSLTEILQATPMWDEVIIQEEGESGNCIQSHIKVPLNPSFPLQQNLFILCQEINKVGPHAIPKKIQSIIMEETASITLNGYANYLLNYAATLPQAVALQLLFDVRFISALLLSRDNKDLQEKAKHICESLEGRVDPFDLDVFNPHVQARVKKAVQRSQFLFGSLITCDRHAILWASRTSVSMANSHPEAPSVVHLVAPSPRLLPLPIIGQTPRSSSDINFGPKLIDKIKEDNKSISTAQKKSMKEKRDTSPNNPAATTRSSAASFFGAMTSTWGSSIFGSDK